MSLPKDRPKRLAKWSRKLITRTSRKFGAPNNSLFSLINAIYHSRIRIVFLIINVKFIAKVYYKDSNKFSLYGKKHFQLDARSAKLCFNFKFTLLVAKLWLIKCFAIFA